jgi:2-polyprenyl-6-methoxyphenol hydroxylase-like FAD-dependent oxidoreductase
MESTGEHAKNGSQVNGESHNDGRLNGVQNGAIRTKGLNVLVVGAGFGGLAAAIECQRQGHSVSIYESFPEFKPLGDLISFGSNAGRIFRRWIKPSGERVSDLLEPSSIRLEKNGFTLYKWDGDKIMTQHLPPADPEAPTFTGHRGAFHQIVFEYAKELGIPIHLDSRVKRYFEDSRGAGIELDSGEVTADVVIAADGIRSKARETVLGYPDDPKPSGHTALRAWFTNEEIKADPEMRRFFDGDTFTGWIGKGVHFLFSSISHRGHCAWSLTFSDEVKAKGPSRGGKAETALVVFDDWDPICRRIISKTPEEKIIE